MTPAREIVRESVRHWRKCKEESDLHLDRNWWDVLISIRRPAMTLLIIQIPILESSL